MTDNDNILAGADMWNVYEVARAVNAVNDKVDGLQGQADAHEAMIEALFRWVGRVENLVTGEGRQAADNAITHTEALRVSRGIIERAEAERVDGGQAADGKGEALTVDDRLEAMQTTWQTMSESYVEACAEAKALRAERDAAQARVAELEKEDTERLERGREKARHMEKEIATLKHAVRGALENLAYGQIWTPYDTQYVRDAIAALQAALGEESSDAH